MKPLFAAALLIFSAEVICAQQGAGPTSGKPAVVQGSGCVEKAVESSCLVLKDSKTGETYNLMFGDHPLAAGTAIRFKGAEHQGMTTCMQSKAVNVTKWKRVKGEKCAAAPAEAAH